MPMVHRESVMPAFIVNLLCLRFFLNLLCLWFIVGACALQFIVNLLCIAVHPERVQKIMENQPPDFPSGD